jgi:ABC-type polysaccharide/polyol phosphate transport system ATPase subunit
MSTRVVFDHVWKRFRRGERHDSLRDLVPSAIKRAARRLRSAQMDEADERDFWALRDVSFEVAEGDALGIIGQNGAGKSTVLKLLTRILRPTRGTCAIVGRTGALIEIAAGFHPDLTGRENIFLQGAIMGMRRAEIALRFDEIVAFAGVEPFIDTQVKRYSSGMHARLGFSIAAHLDPDVLLIDEVLSVGDMAFQEKCRARMKRFRDEGVALIFVSHHLPAVADLCNRVLLLDHGRALRLGPPAEVLSAYCGGETATADMGDVVIGATLSPADSARGDVAFEVPAGDPLELEVTVDFRIDVERAMVGVVVWDLTRELYVYGASSDQVGVPAIQAGAGERRTLAFTFDANLTRGLYAVEVNVFDLVRQRFLGIARGIRHFHVVEHVSDYGVANLYLRGHASEGEAARGGETPRAQPRPIGVPGVCPSNHC